MRLVGFTRHGTTSIEVADLTPDGGSVTVIAPLEEFWADAPHLLCGNHADAEVLARDQITLVPPVLPVECDPLLPPGRCTVWPGKIRFGLPICLFAAISEASETPCSAAMLDSVSPLRTV